jgi:hypothetical protein
VGSSWTRDTPDRLFREHVGKLTLPGNIVLAPAVLQVLPVHLRLTYGAWALRGNLKGMMSKAKYHRHRVELMKLGINISHPPSEDSATKIPLSQYIERPCNDVPLWAEGTDLYCDPVSEQDVMVIKGPSINVRLGYGVTNTWIPETSRPQPSVTGFRELRSATMAADPSPYKMMPPEANGGSANREGLCS